MNDNFESRKLADKAQSVNELHEIIKNFDGCALKKYANNTVFADGIQNAEIMLVGEAPGMNEDKYGIPFCGQSGKLLDNMLASIGLARSRVYISNTVFWRPPNNRRPTAEEIHICRPFVEKHISLIAPKILIMVGSTAVESLMCVKNNEINMHRLRKHYWEYSNSYTEKPIISTTIFHPSYLLRNPIKKKEAWFDMLKLQETFSKLKSNNQF